MNLIISIIYAPIILFCLKNFDIKTVSIFMFLLSFIWLIIALKKPFKEYIFPFIYLVISIFAFLLNSILVLKLLPSILSFLISCFILYSYFTNNSFIFVFLNRLKKQIDDKQRVYIQKSTLFWFFIALINLFIHCYILYIDDIIYWTYYSSIGWYFIFIIGGIIQFLHKKLFFKKEINV